MTKHESKIDYCAVVGKDETFDHVQAIKFFRMFGIADDEIETWLDQVTNRLS